MWGTPEKDVTHAAKTRFIPTGVGNTESLSVNVINEAVHPHGCGEHEFVQPPPPPPEGSSPRVWGTRCLKETDIEVIRFIPTGVGNTFLIYLIRRFPAVHPHGCGEHMGDRFLGELLAGSSPRVWGTHRRWSLVCPGLRFIPTGVGNTRAITAQPPHHPVHPHGCGEH